MEKDIDDLLDEVETKFMKTNSTSKEKPAISTKARAKTEAERSRALDEVIDDILDIDVTDKSRLNNISSKGSLRSSLSDETCKSDQIKRCFPVFLGGSADAMGRGSSVSTKACDQLRCTSCDFKVCCFDDMAWSKDTDYLFLRNNVPDLYKLKSKLSRKKGCRAYCCQCSWQNIVESCELKDPNLRWVCGKHLS